MNEKNQLNDKQKSRLYGLTAIVCSIWTVQTIITAVKENNLWTWLNLIFYISMFLVILYTGVSAYQMWKTSKKSQKSSNV